MEERLRNRIGEHFSTLFRVAPMLQEAELARGQPSTSQKLYLPSDFSSADRTRYKLENLAAKESQLQVAEAHDALRRLRNALGLKALLLESQKIHIRGYDKVSKAQASINTAEKGVKRAKEAYNRARTALTLLGVDIGPESKVAHFQVLTKDDLKPLRDFTSDRRFVAKNQEIPWIWKSVGGLDASQEGESGVIRTITSWNNEGERIHNRNLPES